MVDLRAVSLPGGGTFWHSEAMTFGVRHRAAPAPPPAGDPSAQTGPALDPMAPSASCTQASAPRLGAALRCRARPAV